MTKLITLTKEYDEMAKLNTERKELLKLKRKYLGIEESEKYLQKIEMDLYINYLDMEILQKRINKKMAAA